MSLHSFDLSKPFPFSPAKPEKPLPFAIDEMDFSLWYKTLSNLNDYDKCTRVLEVLQTLNSAYPANFNQIPGRTRLYFLEKLGNVLDSATEMLTYFPSTNGTVDDPHLHSHENARSNISVWCSLELGNAYSLLSHEELFRRDDYYSLHEKTSIIANGIQSLSKGLLYISQTYSVPHTSFWFQCYQLYWLGLAHYLTDEKFNPEASRIDNEFKRILVFALGNTNQFSPQEMRTIFEILGHYSTHASLLRSVPKKRFQGIPIINLKGHRPPSFSDSEVTDQDPNYLYIATVSVASKILEATYDRRSHHPPMDRLMLMRLAKALTLNKQRKDPRSTERSHHFGMMGFDFIVAHLNENSIEKDNKETSYQSISAYQPGEIRDLDFEIEVLNDNPPAPSNLNVISNDPNNFQVVEFTDPSTIWQVNDSGKKNGVNLQILDKSSKGFGLLWTDKIIKPKVGNIIGILHQSFTIGMIRWLAQSKETGMFMGVEIVGTNAITVKVSNPGYPDQQVYAIYLPAADKIKEYASLIFMNQKEFQPNEFLFLNKNHKVLRYRQTRQIHLTSFIKHLEVVRSS